MDTNEIRERIALMGKSIKGVKTVHPYWPRTLSPAELPALVVGTGNASYDVVKDGSKTRSDLAEFTINLYVAQAAAGTEGEAEKLAGAFLDRIADYFSARPGLRLDERDPNTEIVMNSKVLGHRGIRRDVYPGSRTPYVITNHILQVENLHIIRFKD